MSGWEEELTSGVKNPFVGGIGIAGAQAPAYLSAGFSTCQSPGLLLEVAAGYQRPAALGGSWDGAAGAEGGGSLGVEVAFAVAPGGFGLGCVGTQGVEGVVGDQAAPNEGPQSVEGFAGVAAAERVVELGEEAGSGLAEGGDDLFFFFRERVGVGARYGK